MSANVYDLVEGALVRGVCSAVSRDRLGTFEIIRQWKECGGMDNKNRIRHYCVL